MKFLIMVRATAQSESGEMPADESIFTDMAAYHEALFKAGVLRDASGLQPSSRGWRVQYRNGQPTVIDGPFKNTNELIAGYTLIEVGTREEALDWARRFPAPFGKHADSEIEVRQLYELDDFEPNEGIERFRTLEQTRHDDASK
jgi:hypothetical protein